MVSKNLLREFPYLEEMERQLGELHVSRVIKVDKEEMNSWIGRTLTVANIYGVNDISKTKLEHSSEGEIGNYRIGKLAVLADTGDVQRSLAVHITVTDITGTGTPMVQTVIYKEKRLQPSVSNFRQKTIDATVEYMGESVKLGTFAVREYTKDSPVRPRWIDMPAFAPEPVVYGDYVLTEMVSDNYNSDIYLAYTRERAGSDGGSLLFHIEYLSRVGMADVTKESINVPYWLLKQKMHYILGIAAYQKGTPPQSDDISCIINPVVDVQSGTGEGLNGVIVVLKQATGTPNSVIMLENGFIVPYKGSPEEFLRSAEDLTHALGGFEY